MRDKARTKVLAVEMSTTTSTHNSERKGTQEVRLPIANHTCDSEAATCERLQKILHVYAVEHAARSDPDFGTWQFHGPTPIRKDPTIRDEKNASSINAMVI